MKLTKWIRPLRGLALALGLAGLALALSGCVIAVGNEGNKPFPPTLGQQLTDLKKARDNGAITQEEYKTQRAKLLEEHGKKAK